MKKYNPVSQPNAEEWLAMDEQSRIDIVAKYHRRAKQELPNVGHQYFDDLNELTVDSWRSS